jgi:ribosomal protein S27AE
MPMPKCVRCGSELLAAGALYGPRRMSFRPEGTKFLTLETGDVMTKVTMCRECGLIEITGDVGKLGRLTSET